MTMPNQTLNRHPSTLSYTVSTLPLTLPQLVPEARSHLPATGPLSILLLGIESHICITQTTLDLLHLSTPARPIKVYLLADGISSCNAGERNVAFNRLAREGAIVTSSESVIFESLGDAAHDGFRDVSKVVKECKDGTREGVEALMGKL